MTAVHADTAVHLLGAKRLSAIISGLCNAQQLLIIIDLIWLYYII